MSDSESNSDSTKITKEKSVVKKMIVLYCNKKHEPRNEPLCADCQELLDYSHQRLDNCKYGEEKPTCRKCPTHCYMPSMREEIRSVMRFSGPRLLVKAPVEWIRHKIEDRRE